LPIAIVYSVIPAAGILISLYAIASAMGIEPVDPEASNQSGG